MKFDEDNIIEDDIKKIKKELSYSILADELIHQKKNKPFFEKFLFFYFKCWDLRVSQGIDNAYIVNLFDPRDRHKIISIFYENQEFHGNVQDRTLNINFEYSSFNYKFHFKNRSDIDARRTILRNYKKEDIVGYDDEYVDAINHAGGTYIICQYQDEQKKKIMNDLITLYKEAENYGF